MIADSVIELSRLQFAATALYHFLFVPLTIGLILIIAIMESVYVMTNKPIYKDMTKFWGKLFAINFALGVTTGLTMEFQFGMNWAYYSHYVGDVFGAPLAIEGLMAFFLESTFVGMFIFGWERLSKLQHLVVTWLTALGTNLSALWILIANAWMQHPIGASFNIETMRMEMTSFTQLLFNPVAQVKFVHTVSAGYVTGAMFVLGISAYYLIKGRDIPFARRSFAIAAAFGMASVLSVLLLGDESGYEVGDIQKAKLAAIESEWETQEPPASFTVIGWPNQQKERTDYAVHIPYLLGLIATRSLDEPILGLKDLMHNNQARIRSGMKAYTLLEAIRTGDTSAQTKANFDAVKQDLGYGLLLIKYTNNVADASEEQIQLAAKDSIPHVAPLFFAFRIMVGCGMLMLVLIAIAFYDSSRHRIGQRRWHLKALLWAIPLPWIASEAGWFVVEYGRQPWTIAEVLPTALSTSSLQINDLIASLVVYCVFYTVLLIVEIYLMVYFAKQGPSSLKTGRYYFEQNNKPLGTKNYV